MNNLDPAQLKLSVSEFVKALNLSPIPELYGVTDGKAVGTFIEHRFLRFLRGRYAFVAGSSASGIDFPELKVDLKVTSIRQPQSSCPYRDASQKVYGLGYHLLVLVYDKRDDEAAKCAVLEFRNVVFISSERTADYQTTLGLREILRRNGNKDDVIAFLEERSLPLDEIGREALASRILQEPPQQGYLTVSNALQWRLQYGRIVSLVNSREVVEGVESLLA